jgi:two-component system sensor histidine kinase YesM
MVLIFSVMMLLGLFLFSSYAINFSIEGANVMTESRFRNMAVSIRRDLEQEVDTMKMTLRELTDNTTFMSALNQMVRDDTEDQKMAKKAEGIALNQLLESPLVNTYYRVTFYTRDGLFLSSLTDKADTLSPRTDAAVAAIGTLSWLDEADASDDPVPLSLHRDIFTPSRKLDIYGLGVVVNYHGNPIGYLEVAARYDNLKRVTEYVDEPTIAIEAVFDDGDLLFSSQTGAWTWPSDLANDSFSTVTTDAGESRMVYRTYMDSVGLNIYISQNSSVAEAGRNGLRHSMISRALLIMIPTVLLIAVVSIGLTRSIRRLTRKVRRIGAASMFSQSDEGAKELLAPVTSPRDSEIHGLEMVFDRLMRRLRDSTSNELALREGTLQAQLSALQTQINPHFIYNTLNIISAKSMESGNYEVIEICDQFANMLRYSTDTRSRTATMAEEIDNVRNYLMLAKARYEDNLEYTVDVPENLNTITVPKLTLQPLVENAMTHGFNGLNVKRNLAVTGEVREGYLILEIRDNGTGFSDEMLQSLRDRIREIEEGKVSIEESGGHIGLVNTCLRLHYYSQGKMRVSIRNENGAVITLSMPFGEKENPV